MGHSSHAVSGAYLLVYIQETGGRIGDFNSAVFDAAPPESSSMVYMLDLLHHSFVSDMHLRLDNSGVDYSNHGVEQDQKHADKSYRLLAEMVLTFFNTTLGQEGDEFGDAVKKIADKNGDFVYLHDRD